jgi:hypothetical protein
MVLDPRTKKYLSKVLPEMVERTRLWNDVKRACIEIAREIGVARQARINENQGCNENQEGEGIRNSNVTAQTRRKVGAASFFPDSSEDEAMENEEVDDASTVEDIVAGEIRRYQLAKGLKLETEGSYNCPLSWWRLHHADYPHVWKLAKRILAIPATSAPSERVFSAAANIVNKKRVSLKPDNVDLLVFLRGNKEFVNWD